MLNMLQAAGERLEVQADTQFEDMQAAASEVRLP